MFDRIALEETGRKAAGVDVKVCTDDELFDAAVGLEHLRSLVEAASAHVLGELDARDACDTTFGLRTAAWLASQAGVAPGSVRQRLRVARLMRERLPLVDEALCDGRLSFDHAKVLAQVTNPRVTSALADVQDEIITLAAGCCFAQWKTDVTALVALLDQDGPEPDDDTTDSLSMATTIDGLTYLKATLGATTGATVRSAITAGADRLYRRYAADHERCAEVVIPSRNTLNAMALAEIVRLGISAANENTDPETTRVAPRAEVTLVLHDGQVTDTADNPIPEPAAAAWACDPDLWAVVVDDMGVPLDAGHTHRLATAAQRRAITARDGGCTFPGCDAPPAWVDLHHLQHWLTGGRTDLSNLAALCRHHHMVTHRRGWTMHTTDDQRFWWTTPAGQAIWGQRHHRQHQEPPPTHCDGCLGCRGTPRHGP